MGSRVTRTGGAAVLAAVLLSGCGDDPEPVPEEDRPAVGVPGVEDTTGPPGEPETPDEVAVDDLVADVEELAGDDVTVTGSVEELLTEQAFTLSVTEGAATPLLVIADDTAALESGAEVTVVGAFEDDFRVPDVESFLATDLDESVLGGLEGQPYIAAEDVEPAA